MLEKELSGFKTLEMLVDSGAAANVLPEKFAEGYTVVRGEAARKGVHYVAADGGRIPNLGECKIHVLTKEQHKSSITFQVEDAQKPILSVSALSALGHEVVFGKTGGVITHVKSRRKIHFQKKGGVCKLEVLMAPGGWVPPKRSATADGAKGDTQKRSATADGRSTGFPRQGTR